MRGILRVLRGAAIGAALLVALLAALEIVLRIGGGPPDAAPRAEPPAFDEHDPAPYVMFQSTPDADVHVESKHEREPGEPAHVVTDRHGFRYDGDLDEPKAAEELRIFMLGGSVVFRGRTNETTICGALERKLAARRGAAPVRCVNAGIVSAVSDQEIVVLTHKVADLEPDLVVVFDGFNEIWCRTRLEPRLGYPFNWTAVERALRSEGRRSDLLLSSLAGLPSWKLMLSRSRLATALSPGLRLDQQLTAEAAEIAAAEHPRPHPRRVADHLLRNWRTMNRIAAGLGTKFVAILQPAAPGTRWTAAFDEFYSAMNYRIERARAAGEPFFSFDRLLDDRPELFYDEVHTFDEGHEVYAERILELLAELKLLDRPR